MKTWIMFVPMLFMCAYFFIVQTDDRSPQQRSVPVTLQLPEATPQAISNVNQQIIGFKQQLKQLEAKNTELATLIKQKKELSARYNAYFAQLQKQQEQNNPFYSELKAILNKKSIDEAQKRKQLQAQQAVKVDASKIANTRKTLQQIKTKINRIAPERKKILKELHGAQKSLKDLKLSAEIATNKEKNEKK